MIRKLAIVVMMLSGLAFGQGARFDQQVLGPKGPIPNVIITVCTPAATSVPCSPPATTYTDITLSTSCGGGTQVTLPGQSGCQATSDSLGNYGFWVAPGQYRYSLSGPGISGKLYDLTLPVGATSGGAIISIANFSRDCRVDGPLDRTGAVDSSATINTCIANAKAAGQNKVILPAGNLLINNVINATNFPGLRITGSSVQSNVSSGPVAGTSETNLWCNAGINVWCLEAVGSKSFEIDHLTMTLCCTANMGGATTFVRGGILQGRDNGGAGGGFSNPFCYNEQVNIHDIYITDNGGGAVVINGGRGQVGIYNVGAENGIYSNIQILTPTTMLFTPTDIIGSGSTYQTLGTGCPTSMVAETLVNATLVSSNNTKPLIEANITNTFTLTGILGNGGNALVRFENLSGGAVTSNWNIIGGYEQTSTDAIATSVSLDSVSFNLQLATPAPGFDIKMLANNLTISNSQITMGHLNGVSASPFIDNASTGTSIIGSVLNIAATTSASNTTLTSTTVYAPNVTDANITFNAASVYEYKGTSGLISHGTRNATRFLATNNGTLTAPALGITSSASGWFMNSNIIWQLTYGSTASIELTAGILDMPVAMALQWSSVADPNNGAADADLSRIAPGVIGVGTGAQGSTAGTIKPAAILSGGAAAGLTGTGACATFSTQTGGSLAGRATCTAATAASTLTITPGTTATNGWVCDVQDLTTRANVFQQTATNTTTCTLTVTSVNQNDVFVFTAIAF